MMFQAVRNERRRGLVVGSLDFDPEDPKFKSEPETAKKNQKNGRNSPQQILRGECKKKHKRWDNPRQ
uniref:Uncharacterized protein n=1 Tax=viral metagenome TaxID=1070528 RepID=A0A6C0I6L2_9ZZZZ